MNEMIQAMDLKDWKKYKSTEKWKVKSEKKYWLIICKIQF